MATKDKAYEEHLRQIASDRPKEFSVPGESATEHYVRQWCIDNGLKHDAEAERMKARIKEAKRKKLTAGPRRKLP